MKRAAVGVLLASLVTATAMAGQGYATRGDADQYRRQSEHASQSDRRDYRHDDHADRGRIDHDRGRGFHAPPPVRYVPAPVRYGVYHQPRGFYEHSWRRGERLPVAYYQRSYFIPDYRVHGLRAPPRGYQWVRVNHDAVLALITTGVVLDIAYNLFH